jgi:hypothetical protein
VTLAAGKKARLSGWIALIWLGVLQISAHAQTVALPARSVDPGIPSIESVIGHAPGTEITSPDDVLKWFRTLAGAAPDRVKIVSYARSWEDRELIYAVIASPENLSRIEDIKADTARLASGLPLADRNAVIARTPPVVWLSYGVHGDEISSSDAAIALSHHLLAAGQDPEVSRILSNVVIIIDPMQNPDGRNRFLTSFTAARGIVPSADRFAAEHDQPWPGGRFNHALFDMNRDWFSLTQPETRGRVKAMLEWNPVAVVDAHEMGGDETYFFPPVADPVNPNVTPAQMDLEELIGRGNARAFDRFGFDYFTREVFDAFYPGYGDMWPKLNGAIALTYEQGSARGLVFRRRNGSVLTYADGVMRHLVATYTTALTVADARETFLRTFSDYRRQAVEDGRTADDRYYVIDLAVRRWQAEDLARRLAFQGVRVSRAAPDARLCGRAYPSGALVIDTAQPTRRLIRTLLASTTELPAAFMTRQEQRRADGLPHELYDVTAWSLPLMDGVSAISCRQAAAGVPIGSDEPISAVATGGEASFGYAIPWTDEGQAKLVISALSAGIRGRSFDRSFTSGGRTFPRGTVVFPTAGNPPSMADQLRSMAAGVGAELVPLAEGWVSEGINYGSSEARDLRLPKIALAWDGDVDPLSAGAVRFVIEHRLGVPVTPIRTSSLGRADLGAYDVLILPEGDYAGDLRPGETAALRTFAANGGVLVGLGSAVAFLTRPENDLSALRRETAWLDPDLAASPEAGPGEDASIPGERIASENDLRARTADRNASPDSLPGALAWTDAASSHWLSAGYDRTAVLVSGSDIYAPLNEADGATVIRFASPETLLAGGHLWEENRLQLAYKPYLTVERQGAGMIVSFTQTPAVRAYLNGLNLLLANTILLAPAHVDRMR